MKKSTAVTLIISGALVAGCNQRSGSYYGDPYGANQELTNNTYSPGYGYWHAPYHNWYPYPYNYYRSGLGFYHGGVYSAAPEESAMGASAPNASTRGFSGGARGDSFSGEHFGISRGGFGSSAHGHIGS